MPSRRTCIAACLLLAACGDDGGGGDAEDVHFSLASDLTSADTFYDLPFPSDLRLTDKGTPNWNGLPFPSFLATIAPLREAAMQHPGFPVVPVIFMALASLLLVNAIWTAPEASALGLGATAIGALVYMLRLRGPSTSSSAR